MFRNLLTILFLLVGLSAVAGDNFLNSVVISNVDNKTSIILRSDNIAKVKRDIESTDEIVLTLKNIKQSNNIDMLYKNVSDVDGLIVQNSGNDLKLYIEAPEISKADIVFETPDSTPIIVSDNQGEGKLLWSVVSVAILLLIMRSAKNVKPKIVKKDINEIIKEREKAMYRSFQKEVASLPSINYKLKSYRKHVLRGETIRSYESRMAKLR